MKWRIVVARTAEKELAKLSSEIGQRIGRAVRALEHVLTICAIGHRSDVYR